MTNKSHVGMEANICIVCSEQYPTGLKESLEPLTVTGMGMMCPHHEALKMDGYVALIACDPAKSDFLDGGRIDPKGAWRTGAIAHIRVEAFRKLFNAPVPEDMVAFCDGDVMDLLEKLNGKVDDGPISQ